MTVRLSCNLFIQKPKEELADFSSWVKQVSPGQGDDIYRHNGAGERLVYSAADFEDFRAERQTCRQTWNPTWSPSNVSSQKTAGPGGCTHLQLGRT